MEGNGTRPGGPPAKRMRTANANGGARNRKRQQYPSDIAFISKSGTILTIPCLSKQLKPITGDPIVGLQFVWEYRSPSKTVPPHYQCRLCQVTRLQNDMLAHVKGWKHCFRYIKRNHPDKVPEEEEAALKDQSVRKRIKDVAIEVEKTKGRGQLRVIMKEPSEVEAFQGLRSAIPKVPPPSPRAPGIMGRGPRPGGRFPEFAPHGGPSDYSRDIGIGGYSDPPMYSGPADMGPRRFPDEDFSMAGSRDGGFGTGGLLGDVPGRLYPDEFRTGHSGSNAADRPGLMGAAPEGGNLPSTLLKYLDSFRIENESDAQIVLKVTQKLTDVLMEYRLRSVSSGQDGRNSSMSSVGFSSPPRMASSGDRYSSSYSGPSRYSDGPSRFYN